MTLSTSEMAVANALTPIIGTLRPTTEKQTERKMVYSIPGVPVRWIDAIRGFFNSGSGIGLANILSPRLFTVLINIVVIKLRDSGACTLVVL